jgi:hypothetical protein
MARVLKCIKPVHQVAFGIKNCDIDIALLLAVFFWRAGLKFFCLQFAGARLMAGGKFFLPHGLHSLGQIGIIPMAMPRGHNIGLQCADHGRIDK